MIAIVDYGMGNLRSVQKAFAFLGHEAQIVVYSRIHSTNLMYLSFHLTSPRAWRRRTASSCPAWARSATPWRSCAGGGWTRP